MTYKIGIKILLIIGLAIAGMGLYFGYQNIQKNISYEEAEGIITGFHKHNNYSKNSFPNVTFLYKGDSIVSKIDYYSSDMEIGQTAVVIFPVNDPENAEIKSSLWFVPGVLLILSLFFIIPSIIALKVENKEPVKEEPSGKMAAKGTAPHTSYPPKKHIKNQLATILFFTVSAIMFDWIIVYQVQKEFTESSSSVGWLAIIVFGFVAVVFSYQSLLGWFGLTIELFSKDVDAEFVKVTPVERTVSANGEVQYKWKLECNWNDPRTGRQITFTSAPFEGKEVFYNRSKINVSVFPPRPQMFNDVDLSFISLTKQAGISIVDRAILQQFERDAEIIRMAENEKGKSSLAKAVEDSTTKWDQRPVVKFILKHVRLIEWSIKLAPVFLVVIGALWWFGSRQVKEYKKSTFEESMIEKIKPRPWTFESNPGSKVEIEINGVTANVPSGHWIFSGETKSIPWVVDTHINARVGQTMNYEGFTPSDEQRRLDVTHSTRWNSENSHLAEGEVLLIAEIPNAFPEELKEKLRTAIVMPDSTDFLQDLVLEPDIGLLSVYFNVLMQTDYSELFEKPKMQRYAYQGNENLYLIVTNNRRLADQLVTSYFLGDFDNWKKSAIGNVAMLATKEKLMVVALAPLTEPDQVETMVNFCVTVTEKISRAKY